MGLRDGHFFIVRNRGHSCIRDGLEADERMLESIVSLKIKPGKNI
jgi:hypothetical protein